MADEMYGDGGVDFAKQTFAESRERNRVEAKKQEDFSKKLLMLDTGIRGVNFLINQRADNLETQNAPAKANYINFLNTAEADNKAYNNWKKDGGTDEDYIRQQLQTNFKSQAKTLYPTKNIDEIDEWVSTEVEKLVPQSLVQFNEYRKLSSKLPTFTEYTANYKKFSRINNPRTILGLGSKFVKNIFNSETDESISAKNKKAETKRISMFDDEKLKEVSSAYHAYKATGSGDIDILKRFKEDFIIRDASGKTKLEINEAFAKGTTASDIKTSVETIYNLDGTNTSRTYAIGMGTSGTIIKNSIQGSEVTKPTNPIHLTAEGLQEFLKNIDPTHHSEATRLLKQYKDPETGETLISGVALVQNLNSVTDKLIQDRKYRLPADDQKIFYNIARKKYENLLETKFDTTEKGSIAEPNNMFEIKYKNSGDRVVYVKEEYLARAKKEGWDAASWIPVEKLRLEGLYPELGNNIDTVESKPKGMLLDDLNLKITSQELKDMAGVNMFIGEAINKGDTNDRYFELDLPENNLQMLNTNFKQTSTAKVFWDNEDKTFIIGGNDFKNVIYNVPENDSITSDEDTITIDEDTTKNNNTNQDALSFDVRNVGPSQTPTIQNFQKVIDSKEITSLVDSLSAPELKGLYDYLSNDDNDYSKLKEKLKIPNNISVSFFGRNKLIGNVRIALTNKIATEQINTVINEKNKKLPANNFFETITNNLKI
mgnify:CR=1 FL=1